VVVAFYEEPSVPIPFKKIRMDPVPPKRKNGTLDPVLVKFLNFFS
jgi:hypothetical protein